MEQHGPDRDSQQNATQIITCISYFACKDMAANV